jgi:hypothetical protein
MMYTKGMFAEMVHDFIADQPEERADLEIDEIRKEGGRWIAFAHDEKANYQLNDDGAGQIVINYLGAR